MTVLDLIIALEMIANNGGGDKLVQLEVTPPDGARTISYRMLLAKIDKEPNVTTLVLADSAD